MIPNPGRLPFFGLSLAAEHALSIPMYCSTIKLLSQPESLEQSLFPLSELLPAVVLSEQGVQKLWFDAFHPPVDGLLKKLDNSRDAEIAFDDSVSCRILFPILQQEGPLHSVRSQKPCAWCCPYG